MYLDLGTAVLLLKLLRGILLDVRLFNRGAFLKLVGMSVAVDGVTEIFVAVDDSGDEHEAGSLVKAVAVGVTGAQGHVDDLLEAHTDVEHEGALFLWGLAFGTKTLEGLIGYLQLLLEFHLNLPEVLVNVFQSYTRYLRSRIRDECC